MAARAGSEHDLLGFVDDGAPPGSRVNGVPVLGGFDVLHRHGDVGVYVAIGSIPVHRALVARIEQLAGRIDFPNVVHPHATLDPEWASMGRGNYVAAGARLTAGVRVGDFNIINLNVVVAHDTVLGERCQLNPGAVLNGQVQVEDEVVVGAGAVVMPRTAIGAGAVVGIGAVVASAVPAGCTVAGNPARVVRRPAPAGDAAPEASGPPS
jgi:acetyltransferase EpsM